MARNLMTKADFARHCGVAASSVTKAIKSTLAAAYDGKFIDAEHAAAVKYWEKQTGHGAGPDVPATGVDVRYEEVLQWCRANNRFSVRSVRKQFGMGYERAKRVVDTMNATGVAHTKPVDRSRVPRAAPAPAPATPAPSAQAMLPPDQQGEDEMPEDVRVYADMTLRELIKKHGGAVQFAHWLGAMQKIQAIEEKQLKNATTRGELIDRALVEKSVIDPFNSVLLRLLQDGSKTIAAGLQAKVGTGADLPELEAFVSDIIGSFVRPVKAKVARGLRDVGQTA